MDIAPYLHDDPDNPINKTKLKKKMEMDLIEKCVAPAMLKMLSNQKKQTKKEAKNEAHSISSGLNSTIGSLSDSMKAKYIKNAESEVRQIIQEVKTFAD